MGILSGAGGLGLAGLSVFFGGDNYDDRVSFAEHHICIQHKILLLIGSYGDLSPSNATSRIFTVFYCWIGVGLIFKACCDIGEWILNHQDAVTMETVRRIKRRTMTGLAYGRKLSRESMSLPRSETKNQQELDLAQSRKVQRESDREKLRERRGIIGACIWETCQAIAWPFQQLCQLLWRLCLCLLDMLQVPCGVLWYFGNLPRGLGA